jgi:hypothetical protein
MALTQKRAVLIASFTTETQSLHRASQRNSLCAAVILCVSVVKKTDLVGICCPSSLAPFFALRNVSL